MFSRSVVAGMVLLALLPQNTKADEKSDLSALIGKKILKPGLVQVEVEKFVADRLPKMPSVKTAAEWELIAQKLRAKTLATVVYRGQAATWRDAKTKVEWLGTIKGGSEYRIKKLRYEALPGMWIPALLYEPIKLSGKVPVILNVNGHDSNGKAATYKQIRCINLAKRGMLALNLEWFGMGQLRSEGFHHGRMNQLDLCGSSGLAPFYLNMKRGLDILLAHQHADPKRVAVTGLSGGGWQTIYISALDTRVALTNPVAGYSDFLTRIKHHKDLGDSEQTPCDMATVADYSHFTAMMAPRPTLLTYNSKDDCCFEAGYVLPALRGAAQPIFKLYGKAAFLRAHTNDNPGNHNYEIDNRQAFYKMIGDHFFPGDKKYSATEIPCAKEVKSAQELLIDLPAKNVDFNILALNLAKKLPTNGALPTNKVAALKWQKQKQKLLQTLVNGKNYQLKATKISSQTKGKIQANYWQLAIGNDWTLPVVELVRGQAKRTAILINDAGRHTDAARAQCLLAAGYRVLAVDPFYLGECRIPLADYLFALMVATVGERSLGIQASQLAAAARWSAQQFHDGPLHLVAVGPRTSTMALVAAGLETKAIASLELEGSLGSLKEILEQNRSIQQMPELFCFGLLEHFDILQLSAMVAPRAIQFRNAGRRAKKELAGLKSWFAIFSKNLEPVK